MDKLTVTERGEGPAIVLVHGLTFSGRTWDPIVDLLADRHRVVAVDLPGHGGSGGSGADPAEVVERLHATLSAIAVGEPVVVGHSAGALIATGYASAHPTRAVVNVDQPLVIGPFADLVKRLEPQLRGPDFAQAFAPFERSIGVDELPPAERDRVSATRRVDQAVILDHWHGPLTMSADDMQDMVDGLLDRISVPYLFVAGHELPPPVTEHLRAHLRGLRLVVWPDGGHVVHLSHPERFAHLVADLSARRVSTWVT
jgi:pimeloyl-ACP methyl ester carboxylesterase